mmetsp:Transcript_18579/g.58758  ORF Transcript_18579/g.58758 Transcript_18579/m.58758 type:complete len:251 (+) Transcript_18579:347-1099(+)
MYLLPQQSATRHARSELVVRSQVIIVRAHAVIVFIVVIVVVVVVIIILVVIVDEVGVIVLVIQAAALTAPTAPTEATPALAHTLVALLRVLFGLLFVIALRVHGADHTPTPAIVSVVGIAAVARAAAANSSSARPLLFVCPSCCRAPSAIVLIAALRLRHERLVDSLLVDVGLPAEYAELLLAEPLLHVQHLPVVLLLGLLLLLVHLVQLALQELQVAPVLEVDVIVCLQLCLELLVLIHEGGAHRLQGG